LLVWVLDHLTREGVAETFVYIKRLSSHGVQFVSFTEEHFRTTGPAGELMIAVAAWIAKQERRRIRERVRAGLDQARAHGTRSGNPVADPAEFLAATKSSSFAQKEILARNREGMRRGSHHGAPVADAASVKSRIENVVGNLV